MKNKDMKKRILAIILCLVMVAGICGTALAEGLDAGNSTNTEDIAGTDVNTDGDAEELNLADDVEVDAEEVIDEVISDTAAEAVVSDAENIDESDDMEPNDNESQNIITESKELKEFKYVDDDVIIVVTEKDNGAILEGVSLNVTPLNKMKITDNMSDVEKKEITAVNMQYDLTEQLLQEKTANASSNIVKGFLAYDITLVDGNGSEIEPNGDVQVSIKYKSAVLPDTVDSDTESDVRVMHLVENKSGEVVKVVDMEKENLLTDIKLTSEKKIKKAEFETDSFSVYAIVWMVEDVVEKSITGEVVDLNGNVIAGVPDMTIELPKDGSEIGYEDFNDFSAEDTAYVLDRIQLNETTKIYRFKCDTASGNILYSTHQTEDEWFVLDSVNDALRFVYDEAKAVEINVAAKFANADKTGALAVEDAVISVTKGAGKSVTAEEDYQTFAEYTDVNNADSKNKIKVGELTYQFDGAYVTADGNNYWDTDAVNTKVDALRILGDELQFRTAGTTTWTDMSTYSLSLVYKKVEVITLTAVLADATNKNLGKIEVTLEKDQPVVLIKDLVEAGTIPESYTDNGIEYKFQDAVLVSSLSAFTRQTYYKAVNTKKAVANTVNVLVQGLKLNGTSLQYQYSANASYNIGTRTIVLVYAEDLHTVETIDSKALGVTIRMVNFKNVQTDFGGPYAENVGRTAGLLTNKVGANGYPSTTKLGNNNFNFEKWFGLNPTDSNVASSQEANYLFLKDYYDKTGTFHYSGFENFASMDQTTGNFTVYEEIGASSAISAKYSHQRGHFLPYNTIAPGQFSSYTNMYDPMGGKLTAADSRYNENLYITKETVDYNFGMYLEAEFAQPNNGIYRGEQMVFEFNGDDDFWVYLDGVLVLDIGGIHNAQSGYINFATGEVVVKALPKGTGTKTTIKDMFIDALGKTGVNDYNFKGSTFADGSLHKMQVFYMERGKSASNLYLNFNLPTVPSGTIQVEKQLGNTDQEAYTDLDFAFRVMAQKIVGREEALDANGKHVWIEKYAENEYVPLKEESGAYVGTEENKLEFSSEGIFTLKPTEVANFPNIQADRKYYVEEVNLAQLQLDNKVIVAGDTKYTEDGKTGQENMLQGEITNRFPFMDEELIDVIKTTERAVSERKKVTFVNYITDAVLGNIQIEKEIVKGESNPDYGFDFKVTVQDNLTGNMVPYVGDYYLKDAEGNYLDSAGKPQNLEADELPEAYGRTYDGVIPGVMVGQKAEIRDFYQGTRFIVEEVNLKNIYETPKITYDESTCITKTDAEGNKTYHVKGNATASVKVTNKEKYQYDWTIFKQSAKYTNQMVGGAEFELVSADNSIIYYGKSEEQTGAVKWYTDADRTVDAGNIPAGKYYLSETAAPEGYTISEQQWTIIVNAEDSPIVIKGRYEGEISKDSIPEDVELVKATTSNELDESTGVRHVITNFCYENEVLYELPSTGGPGIYLYLLAGVVLLMGGSTIVYKRRCKEVLRRR